MKLFKDVKVLYDTFFRELKLYILKVQIFIYIITKLYYLSKDLLIMGREQSR